MNIFYISEFPSICAEALDDLRLNKMILETGQMLSTAIHETGRDGTADLGLYKPTHRNHPMTLWVGETRSNFSWVFELLEALLKERQWRTGKGHATERLLPLIALGKRWIPAGLGTPVPNCTPYKDLPTIFAYRAHLTYKWDHDKRPPTWAKRGAPRWYPAEEKQAC